MNRFRSITIALAITLICASCSLGSISITSPKTKDEVSFHDWVMGNFSVSGEPNLRTYVLVMQDPDGPWYLQKTDILPNGTFRSYATFGGDPIEHPAEIGDRYKIVAIITNETYSEGKLTDFPKVQEPNKSDAVIVYKGSS